MGQQLTQGPGALSQRHTHTTFLSTRIVPPPQESQQVLSDRLGTYAATSRQLALAKLKYSFFHPEVGVEYFENHMMITHPMCVAKKQIGSKLKSGKKRFCQSRGSFGRSEKDSEQEGAASCASATLPITGISIARKRRKQHQHLLNCFAAADTGNSFRPFFI